MINVYKCNKFENMYNLINDTINTIKKNINNYSNEIKR